MSTAIVLPTLSAWAASHLSALLQSKTQADFDTAFEATFAQRLDVVVNAKRLTRDEFKKSLLQQSGAAPGEASANVQIEAQTEVLGNQGQLSGLVGLFYSVIADSKYLVFGAPTESRTNSSINLNIEPTEKNPQPPTLRIRGYFDPRRVTAVNQAKATSSGKVELGPELGIQGLGAFGGVFGPGPVQFQPPGAVRLPPTETGATPETLPGDGAFGPGPVIIPGETVGDDCPWKCIGEFSANRIRTIYYAHFVLFVSEIITK
ncbi:hypothetical protein F5141DRAFT_1232438 [Pisolithus sp. B1]|nr:hypothetical protein F5141DRAFT_1232438 [Pisolithus sp. B1]